MDKIKLAPAPLQRRFLLLLALGALFLLVGLAMYLFSNDVVMLMLSGGVCIGAVWKAAAMFLVISKKEYEVVEGTCVGISQNPIQKYRKVKIIRDDGIESSLLLGKQEKIKIGYRYRFYFKETSRLLFGGTAFDTALSSDCFIGFEELGEF